MSIAPHRILQDAIAAVPAVRYAAGIAGVAAAVAIIASFKLGPVVAVLGIVVMLALMAALLAFARAAGPGDRAIPAAGIVMVWVFTLLTCATGIMIFTVTFFGTPTTWRELVGPSLTEHGSLTGSRVPYCATEIPTNMLSFVVPPDRMNKFGSVPRGTRTPPSGSSYASDGMKIGPRNSCALSLP
jgi:hypothetical protein